MMIAAARKHLRSVAAALRDGTLPAAEDVKRLADTLDQIAQGVDADLAFGLRLKPGQHQSQEQIAERDRLWREAAARFWAAASPTEQAQQLCRALRSYRRGRWQRDRVAVECPYSNDKLESYLWRSLRLRDRDIGGRQMFRVLTSARQF
jgi:hypothetical protein